MPWNDQSNGGGPWRGGPQGPWGQPPRGGRGGGGGGGQGPDLEDLIRQLQNRVRGLFGGGSGGRGAGPATIGLIVAFLGLVWVALPGSGWYLVQPDQQGVVLRFGQFDRVTPPGLNFKLPTPLETVELPAVTVVHRVDVGFQEDERRGATRDIPGESLMLTGDENIVDIDFSVFWQIQDAREFLFEVRDPETAVKAVAESAMREVVGQNELEPIITRGREIVEIDARELIQSALDEYQTGILVTQVQLQKADPPARVIDAFRDVVNAGQDAEAAINQATAYRNQVVPEARGDAARIIQEAEAYREQTVADATGQAERFKLIYAEYAQAPDVTRQRMFLETMERVLGASNKIVIDDEAGSGVVPYLPLNELQRNQSTGGQ